MDNEEAILILEKMIPQARRGDSMSMTHTKMTEALSMGIFALRQEPEWIPVKDPLKELPKDRILLVTVEKDMSDWPVYLRGNETECLYVAELYYDMTEWSDIDIAENTIAYRDWPEPYKG